MACHVFEVGTKKATCPPLFSPGLDMPIFHPPIAAMAVFGARGEEACSAC
jgi:hypothetical protein